MQKVFKIKSILSKRNYMINLPPKLSGIVPPITTPFFDDQSAPDYKTLHSNLDFLLKTQIQGVTVLGSNGEFASMSNHEQKEVLKYVGDYMMNGHKEKLLIAGTGSSSYKDTLHLSQYAADENYDYVLVCPPSYYKGTEEGLKEFYLKLADHLTDVIPMILYNIPQTTGINLSPKIVQELSHHKNIVGIKDSSGNIVQLQQIIENSKSEFQVMTGTGSTIVSSMLSGAKGGINALGNIYPNELSEIYKLCSQGNYSFAQKIQSTLVDINQAVTSVYGIPGLKLIMKENGFKDQGPVRLPLKQLNEKDAKYLIDLNKKTKAKLNLLGVSNYKL